MLNDNEENEYRYRPEYTEFVVIYNIKNYRKFLLFFIYSVFVMCVCYNLILYYRHTVSNIMYFIEKILKCFYTTHIHYRTVNMDNYILQLSMVKLLINRKR